MRSVPSIGRVLFGPWHVEAAPLTVLSLAAALYLVGMVRTRNRWPVKRALCFYAGLVTIAASLFSGIDGFDLELLSIHMVQHMLLTLAAPTLLVLGAPVRLAFASLPHKGRRVLARLLASRAIGLLTRPIVGLAIFAIVVVGTDMTGIFELALRNPTVHELEHASYFLGGLLFLAPVIAADPLPHPPAPLARFSWLMAGMAVMTIPGAWLAFSYAVHYHFYLAPAHALHISALENQRLAGIIMVVFGGVAMGALAVNLAVRALIAEERRQRRRESYAPTASASAPSPEVLVS